MTVERLEREIGSLREEFVTMGGNFDVVKEWIEGIEEMREAQGRRKVKTLKYFIEHPILHDMGLRHPKLPKSLSE